ncbi:MAG: hypothetical protein JO097_16245 [Acidobacteriaceae bacterium]|nr:hypothetical protein [Acidobacteriaceae bacterium]MBV9295919.1 hypothetical protein [Acidobacteriaceae bacterium]MBV9765798.1 hypothetical protein [Acidobacteriaceae bacterium]
MPDCVCGVHRLTGFVFQPDQIGSKPGVIEADASGFIEGSIQALLRGGAGPTKLKGYIYEGYDPRKLNTEWLGHQWLSAELARMKAEYNDQFEDTTTDRNAPNEAMSNFPAFRWALEPDPGAPPRDGIEVFVGPDFTVVHEFSILPLEVNTSGVSAASRTESRFAEPPSMALFRGSFVQVCGPGACTPDNWRNQTFAEGFCELCPEGVYKCGIKDNIGRNYHGCILVTPQGSTTQAFNQNPFSYYLDTSRFLRSLLSLFVNHAKVSYESEFLASSIRVIEKRLTELRTLTKRFRTSASRPRPETLKKEVSVLEELFDCVLRVVQTCADNQEQFKEFGGSVLPDSAWVRKQSGILRDKTQMLSAAKDRIEVSLEAARNDVNQCGPTLWQRLTDRLEFVISCVLPLGVAVAIDGKHPSAASFFIILSAILVLIRFLTWDEQKHWPGLAKWLAFVLAFLVVFGAAGAYVYLTYHHKAS